MERSIIQKFQQLQVLSHFDFQRMDELVQDLTNALEESSPGNITNKVRKRRGLKRRSKPSCLINHDFPNISEDSESSFDEALHMKVPLDTIQLTDSDDISATNCLSMLNYLKRQSPHFAGSFVESDSVNENFSPIRPHRRKRKFKRMAVDPLPCSLFLPEQIKQLSNDRKSKSLKILKHRGDIENMYQSLKMDSFNNQSCGKRKRSMRERSIEFVGTENPVLDSTVQCHSQVINMNNPKQEEHVFLEPRQRRDDLEVRMDLSDEGSLPIKQIGESSSSSLSSSESDAGVYTNDEGREGDDEQSDFYFESGPACGVPGVLPWWESDNIEKTLDEDMDPEFHAILTGSFQHMSWKAQQAFRNRISKLEKPGREIRAGRRRLKDVHPGFSIVSSFNEKVSKFLQDPEQNELRLHPVKKKERGQLNYLASLYSLNLRNDGNSKNIYPVLMKTRNTTQAVNIESSMPSIQNKPSVNDIKRRRKTPPPPAAESVVGENAQPISDDNIGNRMLRNMGWEPGTGLGIDNIGIQDPIKAVIRPKLQGLGYNISDIG